MSRQIIEIPINDIMADENQPRKLFEATDISNLAKSITRYGVKVPIEVFKVGGKFVITDGERRLRAATVAELKSIPAIVVEPTNETERLIQQFHIQHQHVPWTSAENAMAVHRLSEDLGMDIEKLSEALAIDKGPLRMYRAFADIVDKKAFVKADMSAKWAGPMKSLVLLAQKIYEEKFNKEFSRDDAKRLENAIIRRAKNGEIKNVAGIAKIRDVFVQDPKSIETFIESDKTTVAKLFIDTKAKSAFYLRNGVHNAMYAGSNLRKFLENPDTKLTPLHIAALKTCSGAVKEVLSRFEDDVFIESKK